MRHLASWPSCPRCGQGIAADGNDPTMAHLPQEATCENCMTPFKWWPFSGFMSEAPDAPVRVIPATDKETP